MEASDLQHRGSCQVPEPWHPQPGHAQGWGFARLVIGHQTLIEQRQDLEADRLVLHTPCWWHVISCFIDINSNDLDSPSPT